MNKRKFLVGTLLAGAMITTSFGTVLAASDTRSDTVEVSYDNRKEIPDPEHPENPSWAVKIPSEIAFTDDNRIIDAKVELTTAGGATALPTNIDVKVDVTSKNTFKLKNTEQTDEISYKLKYGAIDLAAQVSEIGTLNSTNTTLAGEAYLGTDKAKYRAAYSDTLTYKITATKNANPTT